METTTQIPPKEEGRHPHKLIRRLDYAMTLTPLYFVPRGGMEANTNWVNGDTARIDGHYYLITQESKNLEPASILRQVAFAQCAQLARQHRGREISSESLWIPEYLMN